MTGPRRRGSLTKKILSRVIIRLVLVVVVGTCIAYYIAYQNAARGILESVEQYVNQRAKMELGTFNLAIRNHQMIEERYKDTLKNSANSDPVELFNEKFAIYPDGVTRNRNENFDGASEPGAFFGIEVSYTPELRQRALAMCEAVTKFGPAWRNRFPNTYFIAPENFACLYWPEVSDYLMKQGPDFHIPSEEFFAVANEKNNPDRRTVSTGLYIDPGTKTGMISLVTPIYDKDRFLGIVGHDIELNSLIQRTVNESIDGAYNMIFRSDGRLVAHPTKMQEIEDKKGVYRMQESDKDLQSLFDSVIHKDSKKIIVHQTSFDRYLAAVHLPGPDWYFVTVYPGSLVRNEALHSSMITLLIGISTLIVGLMFIYFVIKDGVSGPLQQLISSTEGISKGNFDVNIKLNSNDELGELAAGYNLMAAELKRRDAELIRYTTSLEDMVEERTSKLELQRAQVESTSRLVALGEMAGGIAHEINNPLAIIQGSAEIINRIATQDPIDTVKLTNFCNRISATSERIATIVKGLRNIARDGTGDPLVRTSLAEIFEEVLAVCGTRLRNSGIRVECVELSPELRINCRKVQIQQVLINLLSNSLDALNDTSEPWIKVSVETTTEVISIRVTDSGGGISGIIADKIMMPFYTTKPIGKGTGIGLSISAGLIASHGGRLWLDRENPNTSFVIELLHQGTG